MQSANLTCPFCNSTLNFGMIIAAGMPVECLICMQTFVAETNCVPDFEAIGHAAASVSVAAGIPVVKPRPEAITATPVPIAKKAPSRPAPKRRRAESADPTSPLPLIAVVAGLLLLLVGGGGIAVWKIASMARTDVLDCVPPIALNNQKANDAVVPPATTDQPAIGTAEEEEERQRALEAAKTLLVRKIPVALNEPGFDPFPAFDLRAKLPWGLDQNKIDQAINNGVFYLKKNQNPNGTWTSNHGVGHAAIGGLTLLECGAPADDFFVQRSAAFVRTNVANLNYTYELSLAILFLDRLGDPRDRSVIQGLSLRLLGGQLDGGGWTYHCALLDSQEMFQLFTFLHANKQPNFHNPLGMNPKLPGGIGGNPLGLNPPLANPLGPKPVPLNPAFKQFGELVLQQGLDERTPLRPTMAKPTNPGIITGVPDNKPVEEKPKFDALNPTKKPKGKAAVPIRPEALKKNLQGLPVVQNQGIKKGQGKAKQGAGDNSNTQFAILALWAARRHNVPTDQALLAAYQRFADSQHNDGGWAYHVRGGSTPSMTCVGLLGEAMGHGVSPEIVGIDPNNPKAVILRPALHDPKIQHGLKALGRSIGEPSMTEKKFAMQNLYFMWSVERVAMLYDLKTIDGKDWYGWGAQILVHNQDTSGAWPSSSYHGASPPLNTCFALLFLKRSNLVQDLTSNLRLQAGIRE